MNRHLSWQKEGEEGKAREILRRALNSLSSHSCLLATGEGGSKDRKGSSSRRYSLPTSREAPSNSMLKWIHSLHFQFLHTNLCHPHKKPNPSELATTRSLTTLDWSSWACSSCLGCIWMCFSSLRENPGCTRCETSSG